MAAFDVKWCFTRGLSSIVPPRAPSLSFSSKVLVQSSWRRRRSVGLSVCDKQLRNVRIGCGVEELKQVEFLDEGWEDPDDGSGSEYDDDEEERDDGLEDNDLDFESDWEEERVSVEANVNGGNKPVANNYDEELLRGCFGFHFISFRFELL